jgi:triosephosphate isomerase
MRRRLLIAANWKMHAAPASALLDANGDRSRNPYHPHADLDMVIFPTFLDIDECVQKGLIVGGQWGRTESSGAFTGDISMAQLKAHGCHYVLCGHSERRRYHNESDSLVAEQACAALGAGLHPIVCIGESTQQREQKKEKTTVKKQLSSILPLLQSTGKEITIAYEPVWAIGTGKTATPDDAEAMHTYIRSLLPASCRHTLRLLYGGSVKPENAFELLSQENVDGLLIGGASLDPSAFARIVAAAEEVLEQPRK